MNFGRSSHDNNYFLGVLPVSLFGSSNTQRLSSRRHVDNSTIFVAVAICKVTVISESNHLLNPPNREPHLRFILIIHITTLLSIYSLGELNWYSRLISNWKL